MESSRRTFLKTSFAASLALHIFRDKSRASCGSAKDILLTDAAQFPAPPVYLAPRPSSRSMTSPQLDCPSIDCARWKSWQDVGLAMSHAPSCSMYQHWLAQPEPGLKPATVALAHHESKLIVYAELSDVDIFGTVKEDGIQNFADLDGDVFEIFLRAEDEDSYLEHHITPDNCVLQLRYPRTTAMEEIKAGKHPDWQSSYASNIVIPSRVLVQPNLSLWRILALVPLDVVASTRRGSPDRNWRFSFSRYDYTHGAKAPLLSSTSAHAACNFHEHSTWGELRLV
jgi:hypothetical protein